jgi:integrase
MAGSIRKRSKNSWEVRINLGRDPFTGIRRQRSETVMGNKRDAESALIRLLRERDTGIDIEPSRLTLAQFLERWLRDYCVPNTRPKTYKRYGELFRLHVTPIIGSIPLTKLRPLHIQRTYARMIEQGLSAMTALHCHRVLKGALAQAVRVQLLARNPADGVDPPRPDRYEINPPTPDAILRIMDSAEQTVIGALIHTAVMTGLRQAELLAVRWRDLDLDAGLLRVKQTAQWLPGKGFIFAPPKTPKSRRTIDLSPRTIARLRQQRQRQLEERLLVGPAYQDHDLVFATRVGGPIDPSNLRRSWESILKRAGVGHVRFHDLRHGHASLLLQQGAHAKLISERLGHAGIGITMDTYGHLLPGIQAEAAARLDTLFDRPASGVGGQ